MEKYSKKSEIRKVRLGLIGAITAVNLKQEGNEKEFKNYEEQARNILNYLADPDSLAYEALPILKEHTDTIEKARESFPEPEALNHLQKLLDIL
ncbi:MAG: hypothetical protein QXD55_00760 [Candidatus Aenigmatarchaeota archaeon]